MSRRKEVAKGGPKHKGNPDRDSSRKVSVGKGRHSKKELNPLLVQQAEKQKSFLESISLTGNIRQSALLIGINRQTHYDWLKGDEAYASRFKLALDDFLDTLAAEADRRGRDGVIQLVHVDKEGNVHRKIEYSDSLLMFRMKFLDHRYRERYDGTVKLEQSFNADSLQELVKTPSGRELVRQLGEAMAGSVRDGK